MKHTCTLLTHIHTPMRHGERRERRVEREEGEEAEEGEEGEEPDQEFRSK